MISITEKNALQDFKFTVFETIASRCNLMVLKKSNGNNAVQNKEELLINLKADF